jgi:hypothetical protein
MLRRRMRQFRALPRNAIPEQICRNADTMSIKWMSVPLHLGRVSFATACFYSPYGFSRKSRLAREVPLTNLRLFGRKAGGRDIVMSEWHPSKPDVKAMSRCAFLGIGSVGLLRRHWLPSALTLRKGETSGKLKTISPQLRNLTRSFSRSIMVLWKRLVVSTLPVAERRNSTNNDRFGE